MSNGTGQASSGSNQALSFQGAFQRAAQLMAQGQTKHSEAMLLQLLKAQPKHPGVLHLLAIAKHQGGDLDAAIRLIEQTMKYGKADASVFANACEMYRVKGDLGKAKILGRKAVTLAGKSPNALSNLGLVYFDLNDIEEAERLQKAALACNAKQVSALKNLATICRRHGDRDESMRLDKLAIDAAPNDIESLNNFGAALVEIEEPEEAINYLGRAIRLNERYADSHCNVAVAFSAIEEDDQALIGFKKAIELNPKLSKAYSGLARVELNGNQYDAALEHITTAIKYADDFEKARAYALQGNVFTKLGFPDKAKNAFESAFNMAPALPAAHIGLGHLLMEQGDMAEAEAEFSKALESNAQNIAARLALVSVKKVTEDNVDFKWLVEQAATLEIKQETKAMGLHFSLGKCYDDVKQYDMAFEHYRQAASIKRKRIKYDADDNTREKDAIKAFFSKENIDRLRGVGCTSDAPIFILGMPRSGTTLTEQIIASHPTVHGAGELPDLLQIAKRDRNNASSYPASLIDVDSAKLAELGQDYVAGLQERDPDALKITDKMPANFLCVGLIHLMLPNAKIVHVNRNPVDTLLSQFSKNFGNAQYHSYDLHELGRFYRDYHDLMAHWNAVLPEGSFYDLQYETLISDTEIQAKKLIAYCGLEWDDACLDFHKTERTVKTASITQVRQPIYKSSVERWRSYESHLTPLFEALGDLAPK